VTRRTLILGGARSGKSAHAEGLLPADGPATYVATARRYPGDTDWDARIDEHIRRRPAGWHTIEAPDPARLAEVLRGASANDPPILVDDIATWLTSVIDDAGGWDRDPAALRAVRRAGAELVASVTACPATLVLVSSEVGLGVVPETRSGRLFRDELGALNANLARPCDEVTLLVAGIGLRLR
jgi:adenosylcobinamide kinase/adenosylcobinamide-phosphate guanylyltransferase